MQMDNGQMLSGCGNGVLPARYFQYGNVRIVISEHFDPEGKPMESLLEKAMLYEAKQREKRAS